MAHTLGEYVRQSALKLAQGLGLDSAIVRQDVHGLLFHTMQWTKADFITKETEALALVLSETQRDVLSSYIARRLAHEPLSHILGETAFYGLTFKTDRRALAPRSDSERLVDVGLQRTETNKTGQIIDLGTGSGCLLISFLKNRPDWQGIGLDKSPSALELAKENANRLDVSSQIEWLEGSWEKSLPFLTRADLIISNPPYIRTSVMAKLDPEVRNFDPALALDGGDDGLEAYRDILSLISTSAKSGARVIFEIGYDQGEALRSFMQHYGLTEFAIHKDFSGHNRVVEAVIP